MRIASWPQDSKYRAQIGVQRHHKSSSIVHPPGCLVIISDHGSSLCIQPPHAKLPTDEQRGAAVSLQVIVFSRPALQSDNASTLDPGCDTEYRILQWSLRCPVSLFLGIYQSGLYWVYLLRRTVSPTWAHQSTQSEPNNPHPQRVPPTTMAFLENASYIVGATRCALAGCMPSPTIWPLVCAPSTSQRPTHHRAATAQTLSRELLTRNVTCGLGTLRGETPNVATSLASIPSGSTWPSGRQHVQ